MNRNGVDFTEVNLEGLNVPLIFGLKLKIKKFRKTHSRKAGGLTPEEAEELFCLQRDLKMAQMARNRGSNA